MKAIFLFCSVTVLVLSEGKLVLPARRIFQRLKWMIFMNNVFVWKFQIRENVQVGVRMCRPGSWGNEWETESHCWVSNCTSSCSASTPPNDSTCSRDPPALQPHSSRKSDLEAWPVSYCIPFQARSKLFGARMKTAPSVWPDARVRMQELFKGRAEVYKIWYWNGFD